MSHVIHYLLRRFDSGNCMAAAAAAAWWCAATAWWWCIEADEADEAVPEAVAAAIDEFVETIDFESVPPTEAMAAAAELPPWPFRPPPRRKETMEGESDEKILGIRS